MVFGTWRINGAGFIRELPSAAGANYLYANDKVRFCQTAAAEDRVRQRAQGGAISLNCPNSYLIR
jgi:hypothetical protein